MNKTHEKLNYVEFAACDLPATKAFFSAVFGWEFVDYTQRQFRTSTNRAVQSTDFI